jgi:hypothetical protein
VRASGTRSSWCSTQTSCVAFLNDAGGISDAVAESEVVRSVPFALYVGGTGSVRFKNVSFKEVSNRAWRSRKSLEPVPDAAGQRVLLFVGSAVADFNRDGTLDLVAGPYYYPRPDYNTAREIYIGGTIVPGTGVLQWPAVRAGLHG